MPVGLVSVEWHARTMSVWVGRPFSAWLNAYPSKIGVVFTYLPVVKESNSAKVKISSSMRLFLLTRRELKDCSENYSVFIILFNLEQLYWRNIELNHNQFEVKNLAVFSDVVGCWELIKWRRLKGTSDSHYLRTLNSGAQGLAKVTAYWYYQF